MLQFDDFKKCYGEILYRWGLREKRADVLKFASCAPEPHKGIGTFRECHAAFGGPSEAVPDTSRSHDFFLLSYCSALATPTPHIRPITR